MAETVLDASALIAFLRNEPGQAVISGLIDQACISTVNLTEVITKITEWNATDIQEQMALALPIVRVPFDERLAIDTGRLRRPTRHLGLGLGDRACIATARHLGLPVYTADKDWAELDVGVEIRLIR